MNKKDPTSDLIIRSMKHSVAKALERKRDKKGTKKGSFRKFINKILILFGLTQFDLIQTSDMYGYGLRNSHVQLSSDPHIRRGTALFQHTRDPNFPACRFSIIRDIGNLLAQDLQPPIQDRFPL